MANITESTALRDFIATWLSSAGSGYMWATLHSDTTSVTASSVYASSGLAELSTANGYTAGGKTCGTITNSSGVLDTPDVVWTTGSGETLTAKSCCIWINSSNSITGAALVSKVDADKTASDGGTMTAGLTNQLTIPTPTAA